VAVSAVHPQRVLRFLQAGLEAIGEQPAVDVLSRRLTACGKHYTREEFLNVLRAWIEHVDREQSPNAADAAGLSALEG
jgi:hypothetical protein